MPSIAPSKSITAKSSIAESAFRHIDEIRRLLAQPLDRGVDLRFGHLGVGQLQRDILVIGQLEFRRGHDRGAKTHRAIVAKFDIVKVRQGNDPQLFLRDRLVIAFRDEFLRQLVLDFLAELRFDDSAGRFPRAISRDPGLRGKIVRDRVPFLAKPLPAAIRSSAWQRNAADFRLRLSWRSHVKGAASCSQTRGVAVPLLSS